MSSAMTKAHQPCLYEYLPPLNIYLLLYIYSIGCLVTSYAILQQVAAIGPTTAEAARSGGLPVNAIAKSPTASSLLEAIQQCDTLK